MSPDQVFSVAGLAARYGSTHVLRDVSFSGSRGEILAVMGRSGSGKSTLLKAVAGQIPHESGAIEYGVSPATGISFLYQSPYAFPWYSVGRNVQEATGLSKEDATTKLTEVELDRAIDKYPFELSGGMLRRLGLLMALWGPQSLVLLDEPFAGMDDWTRILAFKAIEQASRKSGKVILMTTHSAEEAIALADRIYGITGDPGTLTLQKVVTLERPRYGASHDGSVIGRAITDLRARFAALGTPCAH